MIKLLTADEMRALDRATSEAFGLPSIVLMEHAGKGVAQAARAMLGQAARHVCLVCGKGSNGGDGFVAARWLLRWGYVPEIFLVGRCDEVEGDARANLDLCLKTGLEVEEITGDADYVLLAGSLRRSALVIDALLGTGLSGPPRPAVGQAIRQIAGVKRPVLSVDIPSGVNADTGEAFDPHVVADRTVTFGAWKRGLALHPGAACAGVIELVDIGLPQALLNELDRVPVLVERADVAALLPPRAPEFHKGDAGRALLVAGSRRFGGAALLAARAACRGGAGLVTLASVGALADALRVQTPEAMFVGLPEGDDGGLGPGALDRLAGVLAECHAVGIGPGLGTGLGARDLLAGLVKAAQSPLVLDADGLNLLAQNPELLDGVDLPWVMTPHPGEAARLLKVDARRVQSDRLGAAVALSRRFGCAVLLKGARTVVASPQGRCHLNPTVNPAMASGGMGDALTGLLTALLAQGLAPTDAALASAWLHGRAAELCSHCPEAGLLASDVIAALPAARGALHTDS
jgi:NAD(P)H-hydrate epimerase